MKCWWMGAPGRTSPAVFAVAGRNVQSPGSASVCCAERTRPSSRHTSRHSLTPCVLGARRVWEDRVCFQHRRIPAAAPLPGSMTRTARMAPGAWHRSEPAIAPSMTLHAPQLCLPPTPASKQCRQRVARSGCPTAARERRTTRAHTVQLRSVRSTR
jgi:hypothetical protein